jgi:hypothetical protein
MGILSETKLRDSRAGGHRAERIRHWLTALVIYAGRQAWLQLVTKNEGRTVPVIDSGKLRIADKSDFGTTDVEDLSI